MKKWLFAGLLAAFLAGCGGGGGGGSSTADPAVAPPSQSAFSVETRTLKSALSGTTYSLDIYLPPLERGARATLPVAYVLDGEDRFNAAIAVAEAERLGLIIVGIHTQGVRNIDYVPANNCTAGGGGHEGYLVFLRTQLSPFIESTFGGDPARRFLLGHSHGGSFVYYALFAQAPGAHHFRAYLASDASILCLPATADQWEADYAASYRSLPVRVHVSHAGAAYNPVYVGRIQSRGYPDLALQMQEYAGGHVGIIPLAFRDALLFAMER